MTNFLAFVGVIALLGCAWAHGYSIALRVAAARYAETIEEREERRAEREAAGPRRGIRLKTMEVRDN